MSNATPGLPSRSPTRNGKKSYAELTEPERWLWYADAYAFEIVCRDADEHDPVTPSDPNRKWYDPELVAQAVELKRNALQENQRQRAILRRPLEEKFAKGARWRAEHGEKYARRGALAQMPREPGEHPMNPEKREQLRQESLAKARAELGITNQAAAE